VRSVQGERRACAIRSLENGANAIGIGLQPVERLDKFGSATCLMQARTLSASLVAPGIHYEKYKDQSTKDQQNDRKRLPLPEQVEVFGDLIKIHASSLYTEAAQSETPRCNLAYLSWLRVG